MELPRLALNLYKVLHFRVKWRIVPHCIYLRHYLTSGSWWNPGRHTHGGCVSAENHVDIKVPVPQSLTPRLPLPLPLSPPSPPFPSMLARWTEEKREVTAQTSSVRRISHLGWGRVWRSLCQQKHQDHSQVSNIFLGNPFKWTFLLLYSVNASWDSSVIDFLDFPALL